MGATSRVPDQAGRFGPFGGRYVPGTLIRALDELSEQYDAACGDESFRAELEDLFRHYVGRPSPLYHAERLSTRCGGARIYLKREDLNHTGATDQQHAGQALLARRMGKQRVIAETARGSTAWRRRRRVHASGSNVWFTWAKKTSAARGPTCSA